MLLDAGARLDLESTTRTGAWNAQSLAAGARASSALVRLLRSDCGPCSRSHALHLAAGDAPPLPCGCAPDELAPCGACSRQRVRDSGSGTARARTCRATVSALVAAGAEVDAVCHTGETALATAVRRNDLAMASALLASGANVLAIAHAGALLAQSTLACRGHHNMLRLLLAWTPRTVWPATDVKFAIVAAKRHDCGGCMVRLTTQTRVQLAQSHTLLHDAAA